MSCEAWMWRRLALAQSFAKFYSKFGQVLRDTKFRRNLGAIWRVGHFRAFQENFDFRPRTLIPERFSNVPYKQAVFKFPESSDLG